MTTPSAAELGDLQASAIAANVSPRLYLEARCCVERVLLQLPRAPFWCSAVRDFVTPKESPGQHQQHPSNATSRLEVEARKTSALYRGILFVSQLLCGGGRYEAPEVCGLCAVARHPEGGVKRSAGIRLSAGGYCIRSVLLAPPAPRLPVARFALSPLCVREGCCWDCARSLPCGLRSKMVKAPTVLGMSFFFFQCDSRSATRPAVAIRHYCIACTGEAHITLHRAS